MPSQPAQDPKPQSGARIAIALVVVCAIALRLWRVRFGLPDFLEEAIPFRIALTMMDVTTGAVDWNPHDFHYPSLGVYLHFAVQQVVFIAGLLFGVWRTWADYMVSYTIDPNPMVIAARGFGAACDALLVVAVWRIGDRFRPGAGLPAALIVAISPILVTTARSIYCDSIMTALAAWSLERMLAWQSGRRLRDLMICATLVGLAAGAKYPAGALVIPLGFVMWRRLGSRGLAPWLAMSALALAIFLVTTPFALLDARTFWRDFSIEARHAATGHLGSIGPPSFLFHHLAANIGWVGLAMLASSLALSGLGRERRTATFALWLGLLVFAVPISLARIDADLHLAPVISIAAALAAGAAATALGFVPRLPAGWASAIAALALMAPLVPPALQAAQSGAESTQLEARRWCESNLAHDALLLQEAYAAHLPDCLLMQDARSAPAYRLASDKVRDRFDAIQCFHVVALPLQVSGSVVQSLAAKGSPPVTVPVVGHAIDLNRIYYDPSLFAGADYVMTSRAVRGRFEADSARHPVACALYRLLDSRAEVVARFGPHARTVGPEIVVYRIGPGFREAPEIQDEIDPHWWADAIPDEYRQSAQRLLAPNESAEWVAADSTFAVPPAWVRSLAGLYSGKVRAFAAEMANELALAGRDAAARALARATLEVLPGDAEACKVYAVCSGRMGRWRDARRATERTIAAQNGGEPEPGFALAHARALAHTGDPAGALRVLQSLATVAGEGDPVGQEARRMIAALGKSGPVAAEP